MADNVRLQVGDKHLKIETGVLPPIGTQIRIHKHHHDGSTSPVVELLSHEWEVDENPVAEATYERLPPGFTVRIQTRLVSR